MKRALLLFCLLLAWPTPANAAKNSTLERLARSMHKQLKGTLTELTRKKFSLGLFVSSISSDTGKSTSKLEQQFTRRLLGLIKSGTTLRRLVLFRPPSATTALPQQIQHAGKQGLDRLLRLEISIKDNYMIISGHLFNTNTNIWLWGHQPAIDLKGYYFISTRIDAEIKFLLGRAKQKQPQNSTWALQRFRSPDSQRILAVVIADIDGDKEQELAVLTRRGITVMEWQRNRFIELKPAILFDSSNELRRIRRHPVGALLATDLDSDGSAELVARTSYHKSGSAFKWKPTGVERLKDPAGQPLVLPGFPLAMGPGPLAILGSLHRRAPLFTGTQFFDLRRAKTRPYPNSRSFYGFARQMIKTARNQMLISGLVTRDYDLLLFRGGPKRSVWHKLPEKSGVAFCITDLDDDGSPELVQSGSRFPSYRDSLTIWQLNRRKKPTKIYEHKALEPIVHLTSGDVDNDGQIEVVVSTWSPQTETSNLYVLRRIP